MRTLTKKPILVALPFVLSVAVLQFVIPAISLVHPGLSHVLSLVSVGCCIAVLLIWAFAFGKHHIGRRGKAVQFRRHDMHLPQLTREKKASTVVSVDQLVTLRDAVQRLGLALHGVTPEQELARRTHFQMHGDQVPPLVLPPQNDALFAEYNNGLVKMLTHFGFPFLECVRLEPREFEFFLRWERDLEMRLQQSQQRFQTQQYATRQALSTAKQLLQSLGETYPTAQDDAGYQRLQGALRLLEKMYQDDRTTDDLVQSCLQRLQRDVEALLKQLQQAA